MLPKIFDGSLSPPDFNAVTIKIDGSPKSDLNWKAQMDAAQTAIEKGLKIMWEIDLALFSRLSLPLSDEAQVSTLKLSLAYFVKEVWERFAESSLGLILYRGSCDFTRDFHFNQFELQEWLNETFDVKTFYAETGIKFKNFAEANPGLLMQNPTGYHLLNLYCRDVCIDYLDFICQDLPDALPLFLLLDASPLINSGELAQILSKERFKQYTLAVHGGSLPLQGLAWDDPRTYFGYIASRYLQIMPQELPNVAVCLPAMSRKLPSQYQGLQNALDEMNRRHMHYKIIAEPFLTMEWDQLDYLLFIPEGLSEAGQRKLQGFCAAGGTAVSLGAKIGLPLELEFNDWAEKLLETL